MTDTEALSVEEATAKVINADTPVETVSAQLDDEDEAPDAINPRQASERLQKFRESPSSRRRDTR